MVNYLACLIVTHVTSALVSTEKLSDGQDVKVIGRSFKDHSSAHKGYLCTHFGFLCGEATSDDKAKLKDGCKKDAVFEYWGFNWGFLGLKVMRVTADGPSDSEHCQGIHVSRIIPESWESWRSLESGVPEKTTNAS